MNWLAEALIVVQVSENKPPSSCFAIQQYCTCVYRVQNEHYDKAATSFALPPAFFFFPSPLVCDLVGDLNKYIHLGYGEEWLKPKATELIYYLNTVSRSALQLLLALGYSSYYFCNSHSSITFLTGKCSIVLCFFC